MKKRTKNKIKKELWKLTKKITFGLTKTLTKIMIIYPAKGVWFLLKKITQKSKETINQTINNTKEKRKTSKINEQKPKIEAKYDPFKELKNKKGKLSSFESKLIKSKSTIGLILGARGTGKSALGMRLLENLKVKSNKNIYALGFKEESLPNWIKVVKDIHDIKNDSAVLIDESGIEFSSRKTMSNINQLLSELLLIARHKDLSVIFITQNSSNLEINAIRQSDYLFLKPSSLLQKDFERKKIKEVYNDITKEFEELKDDKGLTYIYADNYRGFISNNLPSFWNEKVSKSYADK